MAFSKTGYDNVAIGYNAFRGGSSNGAAGGASSDNVGYQNVAVGVDAMKLQKAQSKMLLLVGNQVMHLQEMLHKSI